MSSAFDRASVEEVVLVVVVAFHLAVHHFAEIVAYRFVLKVVYRFVGTMVNHFVVVYRFALKVAYHFAVMVACVPMVDLVLAASKAVELLLDRILK